MQAESRISVVLEWDNTLFAAESRSIAMLRELGLQVSAYDAPVELLFCFDSDTITIDAFSTLLAEHLPAHLSWRPIPAPSAHYYTLKNIGASHASGDIIVFLDSDVIPKPGWLRSILAPFADPAVQVVSGLSMIDATDLYSRSFALFWFFHFPSSDTRTYPVESVLVNNIAFRRDLLLTHPFQEIAGASRGACVALSRRLIHEGVTIWRSDAARVAHPAPNGIDHFLKRALAQGRDHLILSRCFDTFWRTTILGSIARFGYYQLRSWRNILVHHAHVGLQPLAIPAAVAIASTYYGLFFTGELLTHLRVPAVRRIRI